MRLLSTHFQSLQLSKRSTPQLASRGVGCHKTVTVPSATAQELHGSTALGCRAGITGVTGILDRAGIARVTRIAGLCRAGIARVAGIGRAGIARVTWVAGIGCAGIARVTWVAGIGCAGIARVTWVAGIGCAGIARVTRVADLDRTRITGITSRRDHQWLGDRIGIRHSGSTDQRRLGHGDHAAEQGDI